MNTVWYSVVIVGLGLMIFNNPQIAFDTVLAGSTNAINLSLKLWAIYAVWLGLLQIVEDTKLDKKIARLLSPIIDFLMGKQDDKAKNQIAINLSCNLLGMGNACTPSGIKALEYMDKGSKHITNAMIMFFVLNTSSLQLIPTTVIGLRIASGSSSPADIILPTLIATTASTVCGIILVKIFSKFSKDKK